MGRSLGRRARAGLAVLFVATCAVPAAHAGDEVTAAAAFDKGLADMEAGQFATGCPMLAESYRLDPRPGVLFTEAECEARWGKLATAVAHYQDFLQQVSHLPPSEQTKHAERDRVARAQIDALEPKIPHLALVLPPNAPVGTTVARDGVILGAPLLGVPLPIDPGAHTITTQAPGGIAHKQYVDVSIGEAKRVELVVEAATSPPREATTAERPKPSAAASPPVTSVAVRRGITYSALVLGGAAMILGTIAGIIVLQDKSTVDEHCAGPACDPVGKAAADRGKDWGVVSTVGFGVGLPSAIVGGVLLLTEPARASAPQGPRTAWLVGAPPTRLRSGVTASLSF